MRTTATPTDTRTESEKRHGRRGVQPPATFDVFELSDRSPLSDAEVSAIIRRSRSTLAMWRQQPDHSLEWFCLPGGGIRYWAGSVKRYLTMGQPRKRPRKTPPAPPAASETGPAPPKRQTRRADVEPSRSRPTADESALAEEVSGG